VLTEQRNGLRYMARLPISAMRALHFSQKYLQEQDMGEIPDEAEE
jgi:hypothetical protein